MSKNLIRHLKKGNIYFKNKKSICPSCKSHKIVEDGNYQRILYFLNFGKRKCFIKVYKKENKVKYWSYSGYYLFDALWIKINRKWKYILALFDLKTNTIINYEIVNSESSKVIYSFLIKSTHNQPRNYIVTDLKNEYCEVIYKLGFKHQFCKFHTKQKINRDVNEYLKKNKVDSEEEDKINWFKSLIFNILDSKTLECAKEIRKDLFLKNK